MSDTSMMLITNLVVVIGWFIVFRQAIHLRNRDDVRKTIDLISVTIDEIYQLCHEYYSTKTGDHINYNSTNIKAKFVLLSHYLLLIKGIGIASEVSSSLTAFKIHATGGHFETVDYFKQEDLPNWKTALAASAHDLKFRVEKSYFDWSKKTSTIRSSLLPAL